MAIKYNQILPATDTPRFNSPCRVTFLKDAVKVQTLCLIGALIQATLHLIIPLRWAIVPPTILLLNTAITTFLQCTAKSPAKNPFNANVIRGRVTSRVPSDIGQDGSAVASIVVFNLGAQFNHPLGFLSPGGREIGQYFNDMRKDLESRYEELGILGISSSVGADRSSNNRVVTTYYFRNADSIHKFAHEKLHREAWGWYDEEKHSHIGIYHETFKVERDGWENLFVNCAPTVSMKMAFRDEKEGEGGKWVSALVSANNPKLKTFKARLEGNAKLNADV